MVLHWNFSFLGDDITSQGLPVHKEYHYQWVFRSIVAVGMWTALMYSGTGLADPATTRLILLYIGGPKFPS